MKIFDTRVSVESIFKTIHDQIIDITDDQDSCPYIDLDNEQDYIDMYYFMNSGDKNTSRVWNRFYEETEGSESHKIAIANYDCASICARRYYSKWLALWNTMIVSQYNPLENYDKTKESLQQTNTNLSNSEDMEANTFGFDTVSEDGVPKDKSSKNSSITGDAEDNYISRESSEHGNNGKYTKQQLLLQEIEAKKHLFYDIMFADIDKVFANRIYESD